MGLGQVQEYLILGLCGYAGSGKTTVADYLSSLNFKKLVFSDVLIEEAKRRNLLGEDFDKNDERVKIILSELGDELRKAEGMDVLARRLVRKIKYEKIYRACVDGFRSVEEVNVFRKEFKNFYLIALKAPKELRFKRRRELDPTLKWEEFEKREKLDEQKGLGKVLSLADFVISNDSTLEDLYRRIDELLKLLEQK